MTSQLLLPLLASVGLIQGKDRRKLFLVGLVGTVCVPTGNWISLEGTQKAEFLKFPLPIGPSRGPLWQDADLQMSPPPFSRSKKESRRRIKTYQLAHELGWISELRNQSKRSPVSLEKESHGVSTIEIDKGKYSSPTYPLHCSSQSTYVVDSHQDEINCGRFAINHMPSR